jgi:AcrR family transcriptional regulator
VAEPAGSSWPSEPVGPSRREQIVAAAMALLESEGPDGLSMRAVAAQVGIKAPSLYKHFPDKESIEAALIAEAFGEVAVVFAAAVDSEDPLASLAVAYRGWAKEHPHLYRLMTHKPLRRDLLPPGAEAAAGAPVVQAAGGDPDLARAAWSLAHGLTSLELAERFPPDADLDAAWRAGVAALGQAVASPPSQGP